MVATSRSACAGLWIIAALAPVSALAQESPGQEPVVIPPPPIALTAPVAEPRRPRLRPRVRFEVALEGSILSDVYSLPAGASGPHTNFGGGGGIALRLGSQINEWLAAQIEGSAGFLPGAFGYYRGAVTVNFTPARWFTGSLGPTLGKLSSVYGESSYAGMTLRADFHAYQHRARDGLRHSLTLGLAGDFGSSFFINAPSSVYPGTTVGAMINIGYTFH